jgi:uncharacterized protein YjbI with pentapeptide repeats
MAQTVIAKAYYAGRREMIHKAESIVIVEITNVENAEKKGKSWTYRQKANGKVVRCLKGDAKDEIEIYGMETFICAQCGYEKGTFILFLRKEEGFWIGSNWQLGIRPITGTNVSWFKDDGNRSEMKETPLDDVISEIAATVKEQSVFSHNSIFIHISNDGTELTIPQAAEIRESDWPALTNSHAFISLRSIAIHNRNITRTALECLRHPPLEEVNLNGATYPSDGMIELLDHLPRIRHLNIANTKFNDKELTHINFANLTDLVIYNTDVTDRGLSKLTDAVNLSHLNLPGKNLTNEGYETLQHLTNLKELMIGYRGVSDATIEYIRYLNLRKLSVYDANISDSSMEIIGTIKSLTNLAFPNCRIGDKGIEYITALDQLSEIRLESTLISDVSLHHLNEIKSLRSIELFSTNISDEGLSNLRNLPNLKHLGIQHTKVTKKGIEAFKERFPSVSVVHNLH